MRLQMFGGLETYAALDVGALFPLVPPARYPQLHPLRVAASLVLLSSILFSLPLIGVLSAATCVGLWMLTRPPRSPLVAVSALSWAAAVAVPSPPSGGRCEWSTS